MQVSKASEAQDQRATASLFMGEVNRGVQTGEGACKAADFVGHDRIAEYTVAIEILVRVDDEPTHLRREPREHVRDQGAAVERDQSLVDTAHPASHAPGKHDAGDGVRRNGHGGSRNAGSQRTCSS